MIKKQWINVILYSLVFVLITSACKNQSKYKSIYTKGHEWKFLVKSSLSTNIDTLYLKILPFPDKSLTESYQWVLIFLDSSSLSYKVDTSITSTTVDESNIDDYINLPSPINKYLRLTKAIPSPKIKIPVREGYTATSTIKININEDNELKGLSINGSITVIGKTNYKNKIVNDPCWVLEAKGESKLGTLKAKYYFNEKLGFVYFYYDF